MPTLTMDTFARGSAIFIGAQFLLGGTVRLFPWPFVESHKTVIDRNKDIAPRLYPLIPFRDETRFTQWLGSWFLATGSLLVYPSTRGNVATMGLVYFCSGVLAYSHVKNGMSPLLPLFNAAVLSVGWWWTAAHRGAIAL